MEKKIVYNLSLNGIKQGFSSIDDLCNDLKIELEDTVRSHVLDLEFTISFQEMTQEEIDNLPEFDGF